MIFPVGIRRNKSFGYLFSGIFLILIGMVLKSIFLYQENPENVTEKFIQVLQQKEKLLSEAFTKTKNITLKENDKLEGGVQQYFLDLYKKKNISIFIYQNDSLIYWSTNSVSCSEKRPKIFHNDSSYFVKQKNGWFVVVMKRDSLLFAIGKILIKQQYPFKNEYLKNDFEKDFNVPEGTEIDLQNGQNSVHSANGSFLFNLKIPINPNLPISQIFVLFLIFLSGFILLLVSLYKLYCQLENRFHSKEIFIISFTLDIILIRVLQFYFHLPKILYQSELFGPTAYTSSPLLPSLTDFLVDSILLVIIAYVFFRHYPGFQKTQQRKKSIRLLVAISLLVVVIGGYISILQIIRDLIVNSTIPFNLQDISSLDFSSIQGCFIISAIFLSFYLFSIRILQSVFNLVGLKKPKTLLGSGNTGTSLSGFVLFLILFSITGTFVMNHYNNSIEKEKRKILALKLGISRDAMAESMFPKTEEKLLSDSILRNMISDSTLSNSEESEDSIERYLQAKYFKGYWNNYTLQATVCSGNKSLKVQPHNELINCGTYFQHIINEFGKPTLSKYLYFLDYGYGYKNYLAILPIIGGNIDLVNHKNIYIEISSKLVFKDIGYPELLIDKEVGQIPDLSDYSYAYYRNGKLTHRVGNVLYSLEFDASIKLLIKTAHYYSQQGFSHYYYPIDKYNTLIISRKESTLVNIIAPFSYLFFIFAFFFSIFFIVVRFKDVVNISLFSLSDRLQLTMSGILALSLIVTGGLVVYYITTLNRAKNQDNLNERTHSLLVELQHKVGNLNNFSELSKEELEEMMTEFSNVFFVDVNLYNIGGRLIATSRPEIFEAGLSTELINREAFEHLEYNHNSYYFQRERIGDNGYNSAYMPFYNDKNQLLAYLNLPYFARQDDLKKEISSFLVAFINVYVFLTITGVFLALIVSNYISRPLRILASRISKLSFGKHNEKIEWKRRDEIGQLVEEYNLMIDELVKSADMLAKSERETAWREMAKQVAHEIKNPLTPMKLSVQHIEKAWREHAVDWDKRLTRFTETMIEQIESLSVIASEFSDFAKMPVTQPQFFDLNEFLENVKVLYQDSSDIQFEFLYNHDIPHTILGDRKQVLRAFTNLINNAIQAIGDKENGLIRIVLISIKDKYQVTISDSGGGISSELANRIFQPNFTTKSGGMGLGLAIVKSIIHGLGGEISFVSDEKLGTSFVLLFPSKEVIKKKEEQNE